jgi:hypothetical protein
VTTTEDVQQAVKALWDAATALAAKVAGGLHDGPVAAEKASPYARFKVTEGPIAWTSLGNYTQPVEVAFSVWDEAGSQDAGAVQRLLDAAFQLDGRTVVSIAGGRSVTFLESSKLPGGLEADPATQQGQDVKVAAAKYQWVVQGSE